MTRKTFAAVVFGAALVGSMKLLGALVVVLIYGWDADEQGRLGMPWNDPDLLVWLFLSFTTALSLACYLAGRRKFFREWAIWKRVGPSSDFESAACQAAAET